MLRLRYIALLGAVGCSPVKDASNVPDAAIDAMDTRPPMIESSNPANMGTKVSILQPISVFFDEPLDPASVSATTVKLEYDQSQPPLVVLSGVDRQHGPVPADLTLVRGSVSYDAGARKISFVPAVPLPYGYQFTLSIDVKDTAGLPFTGKVTFTTYVNGNIRQAFYNTSTGAVTSWLGQPTDMNGRQTKRISGSAPGQDTTWFTPDDPRNQRIDFNFAADGRIVDERFMDVGQDGQYDTPDDPVYLCVKYTYDAQGMLSQRAYASTIGGDAMWCTGDDVPGYNAVYEYMGSTLTGWVLNSTPGPDMVWRNSDDRCVIYFDYTYDARGNKAREVYRNCAGDQLPRTADDTYFRYWDYEYDENGNLTKLFQKSGPGPDATWLTGDDVISFVERYVRNADGLVTDMIRTTNPGADTMWGTDDDTPGTRTGNAYNANKLVEELTTYSGFGPDMMWRTSDDVVSGYSKSTYEVNGNRIDQKQYAIGPDGMWKTPDDRVSVDHDFDLTK